MAPFSFRYISLFLISFAMILATFFNSQRALAAEKEYTVFDARKTLPLSDNAPIYRDYYVNMGVETGVKVGSILSVYRKIPVIDIYTNKAPGDLIVEVAKLQVIQTQKSMSVGRVMSISDPKNIPVVQFEHVMVGDRVELSASQAPGKSNDVADDDDDDGDDASK